MTTSSKKSMSYSRLRVKYNAWCLLLVHKIFFPPDYEIHFDKDTSVLLSNIELYPESKKIQTKLISIDETKLKEYNRKRRDMLA